MFLHPTMPILRERLKLRWALVKPCVRPCVRPCVKTLHETLRETLRDTLCSPQLIRLREHRKDSLSGFLIGAGAVKTEEKDLIVRPVRP